jgi:hypothetical protein
MSASADSATSAPVSAISPPPLDEFHASANIHTERVVPTVSFNAAGTNEFRLRRMEDATDAGQCGRHAQWLCGYQLQLNVHSGS